jgi:pimeloyl-ACP methyl ester carboxylesterase
MPITRTSKGIQVAYTVAGNGPLGVIFQHGWASTGATFDSLRKRLPEEGRTFVALDLAGHGGSPDAQDAHSVDSYASQLLAVADAAGLKRFVSVGHSMGGKYCQYLRIVAPERLIAQIAIAPSPSGLAVEEASDEIIAQMAGIAGNREALTQMFRQIVKRPIPPEVEKSWIDHAAKISGDVLAASMRAFSREDIAAPLGRAGAAPPTLVVGGEHDVFYPAKALGERTRLETPGAVFRSFDAGHDLPNEIPGELGLLFDGYLAALSVAA